jgi:hypothetical protein
MPAAVVGQLAACEKARLLNARYAMIPNNVDLAILEAASVPLASFCRHVSPVVSDPAAMLAQLRPGHSFAV